MYRLPSRRGSSPVRRLPPRRRNGSHCGRGDGSPGSLRVRSDDHPSAERPAHQSCTTARAATCTGSLAPWRRERRRRHVAELNQELLISAKQYWGRHRSEIKHEPDGRLEDIEWADGIAVGTPTRFRNASAQPKLFLELPRPRGLQRWREPLRRVLHRVIHPDQRGARHLSQDGRSARRSPRAAPSCHDPASARATRQRD